AVTKSARR
ncbi:tetratricopeptide repeat family protein, partial [Vibrio parahaemolyticus AQ3810]